MRSLVSVLLILLFSASAYAQAKMPHARIVFLTPKGVDVPEGVSERLTQVADYTETLFVKWMKHWDYTPKREKIFERNADGSVKILFVQSSDAVNEGQFQLKDGNLSRHGKLLAMEKYKLDQTLDVWWVWVYAGDPPTRFQSFLGSGNAAQGGLAQVNYTNIPGKISVDDDIASPFLEDITLKGCIHEFGHALGLPHNGPLEQADLGMPLMGATIINYRNRMKNKERRGYLSDASAAILWKHPLFTGSSEKRYMQPKVEWHDIQVENNAKERNATLVGRVTSSNVPVHTVIVYDLAPEVWTPYFQKPYVARVGEDGSFKITITEPVTVQTTGTFKFAACCENGSMTGDGKSRGIGSTHDIEYRTTQMGYRLGK